MQPPATVTTVSTAAAAARQARGRQRLLTIVGFVLPALIVYVLFVLYPIAQAVYYSAYDWNGLGALENFVGLENYRTVLTDGVFQMAIRHNLVILALLLFIDRRWKLAQGSIFALYVAGYTLGRFWIELMRDDSATMILDQRVNTWVSALIFLAAVAVFFWLQRRRRAVSQESE